MTTSASRDQFFGCLLGQAVADGLGAPYEALSSELVYEMGPASAIVEHRSGKRLHYTDDTEMMIGVAETLAEYGEIREDALIKAFVQNYGPTRGYGPGIRRLVEALTEGEDWRELTRTMYPGGSFGNGAAMRVAPVGLVFCHDLDRVAEQAARSARVTHVHPLGIDGAQSLALAVALAVRLRPFDRKTFYQELLRQAQTEEFQWLLSTAAQLRPSDSLMGLGNGIEAHRSVVTAIACFAASPKDYTECLRHAIGLGGDVDTLAAMTGAISGAHLGLGTIPPHLIDALENDEKGRSYLETLAERLFEVHRRLSNTAL